jgi:SAM-dependent methyltransferase
MNVESLAAVFRCPVAGCRQPLSATGAAFVCANAHAVAREGDVLQFSTPDVGKYEPSYAARYAGLWAYGYETLHSGLDEALYRTVSSFVAEALADVPGSPLIIDAGCGVGRILGDCAALARRGTVIGFDASPAMLAQTAKIVLGNEPVAISLPDCGFPALRIAPRGADNVVLARADVEDLPLHDGCADLALSVNIVDRLPHGPERAFAECSRILKPGGTLVFTDPFNWIQPRLWETYGDAATILRLIEHAGFTIQTWFDDLLYFEILDARGSRDQFRTLAVKARKR